MEVLEEAVEELNKDKADLQAQLEDLTAKYNELALESVRAGPPSPRMACGTRTASRTPHHIVRGH